MVAISYGIALLTQKDMSSKMSPSDDVQAPTAEEGRSISVLFGTKRVKGPNVVWYGDIKTQAIKK
jgi:hypothetical protein